MRLTELEPKWLTDDEGKRVGFIFRCPTRQGRWQSCFVESPPRKEQWRLFGYHFPDWEADDRELGSHVIQGCTPGTHWQIVGGIENASFDALSVTPSLDGSAGGNWHGHITDGQIVGGITD